MGPLQSEKHHAHYFNTDDRKEMEPFRNPEAISLLIQGSSVLVNAHLSGQELQNLVGKFHEM